MNYIKETLSFQNWVAYNSQMNKSDICLWHTFMFMANRFGWGEFSVPIGTLMTYSKLEKNAFYRSRNKLKQLGLLEVKTGGGNNCAKYKMKSFVSVYGTQNETQNGTQNGTQSETQSETQNGNINKTKNQKLKTKNISPLYTSPLNKNKKGISLNGHEKNEQWLGTWNEFVKMRVKIKEPMTDRAKKLVLDKLETLSSDEQEQIKILNRSIVSNWKTVWPLDRKGDEKGVTKDSEASYDIEEFARRGFFVKGQNTNLE